MEVRLDFLKCDLHLFPNLEDFFFVEYDPPLFKVYCRKCGNLLYEKDLSVLRKK